MAVLQQSPEAFKTRSTLPPLRAIPPKALALSTFKTLKIPSRIISLKAMQSARMEATASESYAKALVEMAKRNGTLESTFSDIEKIEKVFSNPQVTGFFLNPVIMEENKRGLLDSIVKESGLLPHTASFLNELIHINRIELISEIVKEFEVMYNKLTISEILDVETLIVWIRSCNRLKDLRKLHAVIFKCYSGYSTVFLCNNLISAYLSLGRLDDARKVFDGLPHKTVVSWTAVLNGYVNSGLYDEAMLLLYDFVDENIEPNAATFVSMLNLCGKRTDYEFGKQVHACIVKGSWSNLIVDSAIVYFYAQCGDLVSAHDAFDRMKERDVVSWTTMISMLSQQGYGDQALSMFSKMLSSGHFPNEYTVCCVLRACGEEKKPRFGKQIHGLVLKKVIKNDVYVGTSLVAMYAKCGEILDSRKVFDRMRKRNMVTWTSIIAGYAKNGLGYEALDLYRIMKRRKLMPNNLTIVSILRACGSIGALSSGREIHAQIIKNSLQKNTYIGSTLVWLYCKCGDYTRALKTLHFMPLRDVVTWTAIISGCAHLGYETQALEFLIKMMDEDVEPNNFTYSSILKACASLEDIQQGKSVHSIVNKNPGSSNVFVESALINMYAKCGFLLEAFRVFSGMQERNAVAWRVMIVGYARNGHCTEALRMMYSMVSEGFEIDDYIMSTVLTVCGDVEWEKPLKQQFLETK